MPSSNEVAKGPDDLVSKPLTWENPVSEGGLEPPRTCCITDSVMYHQSKLTRHGTAGPAFRRRHAAAAPACPAGPGM